MTSAWKILGLDHVLLKLLPVALRILVLPLQLSLELALVLPRVEALTSQLGDSRNSLNTIPRVGCLMTRSLLVGSLDLWAIWILLSLQEHKGCSP